MNPNLSTLVLCVPPEYLTQTEFYASLYEFTVKNWEGDYIIHWERCALTPEYNPTDITAAIDLQKLYLIVRHHGGYDAVESQGRWIDVVLEMHGATLRYQTTYTSADVRKTYRTYLVCYEIYSRIVRRVFWRATDEQLESLVRNIRFRQGKPYETLKVVKNMIQGGQAKASALLVLKNVILPEDWFTVWDIHAPEIVSGHEPCSADCPVLRSPKELLVHSSRSLGVLPFHPYDTNLACYDPPLGGASFSLIKRARKQSLRRDRRFCAERMKFTPPPSSMEIKDKICDEVYYTEDGKLAPSVAEVFPSCRDTLRFQNLIPTSMEIRQQMELIDEYGVQRYDEIGSPPAAVTEVEDPFHFVKWVERYGETHKRLLDFWRMRLKAEGNFTDAEINEFGLLHRPMKGKGKEPAYYKESSSDSGDSSSEFTGEDDVYDDDLPVSAPDGRRASEPISVETYTEDARMVSLREEIEAAMNTPMGALEFQEHLRKSVGPRMALSNKASSSHTQDYRPLTAPPINLSATGPEGTVKMISSIGDILAHAAGSQTRVRRPLFTTLAQRQEEERKQRLEKLEINVGRSAVEETPKQEHHQIENMATVPGRNLTIRRVAGSQDVNATTPQTWKFPGKMNDGRSVRPGQYSRMHSLSNEISADLPRIVVTPSAESFMARKIMHEQRRASHRGSTSRNPTMEDSPNFRVYGSSRLEEDVDQYLTPEERSVITAFRTLIRDFDFPVTQDTAETVNYLRMRQFTPDELSFLRLHWQYVLWPLWEEAENGAPKHFRMTTQGADAPIVQLVKADGRIASSASNHPRGLNTEDTYSSCSTSMWDSITGSRKAYDFPANVSGHYDPPSPTTVHRPGGSRLNVPSHVEQQEKDIPIPHQTFTGRLFKMYSSALREANHPTEGKYRLHPKYLALDLAPNEMDYLVRVLLSMDINLYSPEDQPVALTARQKYIATAEMLRINFKAGEKLPHPSRLANFTNDEIGWIVRSTEFPGFEER